MREVLHNNFALRILFHQGRNAVVCALLITLSFLLTGCDGATVVEDRSQREAIEIVALLNRYGINSSLKKESGSKGKYSVEVDKRYQGQATTLLFEKGYPKESETSFTDLIAQKGLIPNSREIESLRLDHAMAVELEEMIRSHPGISFTKVIVRLNYQKQSGEPSVSVLLQTKKGIEVKSEQIEEIVLRAVPGIKKEDVSVTTHPEESSGVLSVDEGVMNDEGRVIRKTLVPFLFWYWVPEDTYGRLALTLFGCIVVVLVAGGIAGYWYGYYQHSKNFFEGDIPEAPHKSLKYEKPRNNLPGV